ncbi:MAG: ZIP family metal transporter [Coprobacillus sp.]|nr:ZIP family metal transporter [Coprobacillus sp.]
MFGFALVGTVLGALIGGLLGMASFKREGWLKFLQSFSTGALIAFLFIELLSESIDNFLASFDSSLSAIAIMVAIILVVALIFYLLHELLHHITGHHKEDKDDEEGCEDHAHVDEIFDESRSTLATSFIFLASIFIHNIPEGLAYGISFVSSWQDGLILTAIMLLHNIVIGVSMYHSFKRAGKSNGFSLGMCVVAAVPAYVLAIVGYFVGAIELSSLFMGIIYAVAFGSLLYVLFMELLPQLFTRYKSASTAIYAICGFCLFALILFI